MVNGKHALAMRAALVVAAERTLDLQYYSAGDDLTSELLLLHLVDAADRGVRVRLLLDDVQPPSRRFAWHAMAAHPAIEVRLFNPFYFSDTISLVRLGEFALDSERLNRRMHNKLWITDSAVAIIGSRNLGDEYFEANESGNFHDVDMLSVGPVVDEMSRSFDLYWNSEDAVPAHAVVATPDADDTAVVRRRLASRATACGDAAACHWLADKGEMLRELRGGRVSLSWARAQYVYDVPGLPKVVAPTGIEHGSIDDFAGGTRTDHELLIVSPYFVPSRDGLRHLREMRNRGVRVAVLTNSLASTDSPAAHAGYARHRGALLLAGIELYETRLALDASHERPHRWLLPTPASLHAKIVVKDRRNAIVGSSNQDPRSRLHNTEAWVVVESPELAAQLVELFDEASDPEHAFSVQIEQDGDGDSLAWRSVENGKFVRTDTEPTASAWLRFWRGFLGILIPEHML